MIFKNLDRIKYTCKHWLQLQKTAINCKHWRPWYLLHDVDKIIMFMFLNENFVRDLHKKISLHHYNSLWFKKFGFVDVYQSVIDWESARFTKPDKPLNAEDTLDLIVPLSDVETYEKYLKVINVLFFKKGDDDR